MTLSEIVPERTADMSIGGHGGRSSEAARGAEEPPLVSDEQPGELGPFVSCDRPELLTDRAVRLDWLIIDKRSD